MHVDLTNLLCMGMDTAPYTCVCISFFLLKKKHIRPCLKMYCRSATGTGT